MKATNGNVLMRVDLHQKEKYKFSNGQEIFIARGFNYNLREDNSNVGVVIDAANIPTGSLCLVHHNSTQDSYKVFEAGDNVFSVPQDMCFLYNANGEGWLPNEGFVIASRIFKPYKGFLIGIENDLVKNRMWIEKGIHAGEAVCTLVNCDYEIVFFIDGVENHIIRTRVREIQATDHDLTDAIKKSEYLVGINSSDAKSLKLNTNA